MNQYKLGDLLNYIPQQECITLGARQLQFRHQKVIGTSHYATTGAPAVLLDPCNQWAPEVDCQLHKGFTE